MMMMMGPYTLRVMLGTQVSFSAKDRLPKLNHLWICSLAGICMVLLLMLLWHIFVLNVMEAMEKFVQFASAPG